MDWLDVILILATGLAAGFINAIAGGGSLITFPLLVMLGLPEQVANGTNRVGILMQTIASVAGYRSKGVEVKPISIWLGLIATVGAILGTKLVLYIDGELFGKIFAVVMFVMVAMMLFKKKSVAETLGERADGKTTVVSMVIFFFVGLYGGAIQAGVGIIILLVLSNVNRLSLVKSNAIKNMVVFIYTIAAIIIFALDDKIMWEYGLLLGVGHAVGGWISARWSVKKGDGMIKVFMLIVVAALAINLFFF
jgi:uncharacterized membrane protein YfcA